MDLGISGKTALVLGGSKGIGRAIAQELALAGVNVAVVARGQAAIDETVHALRQLGVQAMGLSADLFLLDSYADVVRACTEQLGAPDIAVFNMDPPPPGGFDAVDEAQLARAFHTVVLCYARLLREVLPAMKAKRWGRVVTVGSGTAKQLVRGDFQFGYVLANATRVSAAALAKTVAAEVAPFGVTLNTIGTGLIETGQSSAWVRARAAENGVDEATFRAGMVSHIPVGRMGQPQEMAALCAYLCSARAAYTTGETILCDGGIANVLL